MVKLIWNFGLWITLFFLIYFNNEDSVCMVVNSNINFKTKYISIHYYFIQEKIKSNKIILKHGSSLKQVANIFIKSLEKWLFEK